MADSLRSGASKPIVDSNGALLAKTRALTTVLFLGEIPEFINGIKAIMEALQTVPGLKVYEPKQLHATLCPVRPLPPDQDRPSDDELCDVSNAIAATVAEFSGKFSLSSSWLTLKDNSLVVEIASTPDSYALRRSLSSALRTAGLAPPTEVSASFHSVLARYTPETDFERLFTCAEVRPQHVADSFHVDEFWLEVADPLQSSESVLLQSFQLTTRS
jgi:2'-5' RNA ligase